MATANTYNCFVRLAGELFHEVPKYNISARELLLLRNIHGADAVVRIRHSGEFQNYDPEVDLRRMALEYGAVRVARVFNVMPEMLTGELDSHDTDAMRETISMDVIEREAAGEEVDLRSIVREVGVASMPAAPEKVDTGPLYMGEAAKVEQEKRQSGGLE